MKNIQSWKYQMMEIEYLYVIITHLQYLTENWTKKEKEKI